MYMHVGDDYITDYKGAINAGWDSFLLARDRDDRPWNKIREDESFGRLKRISTFANPVLTSKSGMRS
jgi:FMN phosphatase YigB (HAD superfamily)